MTQVQTIRESDTSCRWRIWRSHAPGPRNFATREAAEHVCDGEFLWIALDTTDGAAWMIDDCPVSLMEVVDHVPPAMAEWVIDQTIIGLGGLLMELVGLELGDEAQAGGRRTEPSDDGEQFARLAGLMTEFMRFAHAGSVVVDKVETLYALVERERGDPGGVRPAAAQSLNRGEAPWDARSSVRATGGGAGGRRSRSASRV